MEYTVNNHYFTTKTPEPEITVESISITDLSDGYAPTSERAYLSATYEATFEGAGITPTAAGFCYGTSTTRAEATSVTVTQANLTSGSGSFYLWQYGLQPSTTYYWWAWVEYGGKKYYTSSSKQFTTKEVVSTKPALGKSWLEMPAEMSGNEATMASNSTDNLFTHTFYYSSTARNYTVCYDKSKMTTLWVAYPLGSEHTQASGVRTDNWQYVDSSLLSQSCQANTKAGSFYSASSGGTNNYDRGHIIPSASRNKSEAMNDQTFLPVNIAPQNKSFNQGMWSNLEGALQSLARNGDYLYVVTGTMCPKANDGNGTVSLEKTYDKSGKEIPVPKYFYKVVLKVDSASNPAGAKAIGFWYTNTTHSGNYYDSSYVKSVNEIEELTGLNFFVNLPDTIEESAESNTSWSTFQNF